MMGSGANALITMALATSIIVDIMMIHSAIKQTDQNKITPLPKQAFKLTQVIVSIIVVVLFAAVSSVLVDLLDESHLKICL
ncbi:MAG: hypothetical protein PHD88_05095 [Firmicutes bacterium]|nr:hypothetical protein [Bacillota bacterium]MDD4693763.1 hypothetical protein [Bacillota bacterium]